MSGDQLEQRMSSFERRMIGLTKGGVLVAVITGTIFFGQAAIMWYQLHEMKAGSAETHDLVEASKNQARNLQSIANSTSANAEAARRFAGASEAHIRAMQAVSRLERRAWIGISDVKASKLEVGQPVLISVGFTNTGKTPAKKLTIVSNFAVARNGEKVDFRYSAEAASPPERNSRGLLTAGGDTHINFDTTRGRPLSQRDIDVVIAGERLLYLHGLVKYDDVFGKHHWMTFCYFMDRDASSFVICKEHNNADGN